MTNNKGNKNFHYRMVAKTMHGLEDVLADELIKLEAQNIRGLHRSVQFSGDQKLLYKANLHLRTAIRILKPIYKFKAHNEDKLYNEIKSINWEDFLKLNQTFAIDAVVSNSRFKNSLYVAQKSKDAIADYFRQKTGQRPSVDVKNPDIRINVYIDNNFCTVALDSSGDALFKRGYRMIAGEAPLNEVLAAGIIMKSEWDKKSSFVDAMCGSGTIVIEAALMAKNIAPGLSRKHFGFMNWVDYDINLFKSICKDAREQIIPELGFEIVGSDKNFKQVEEAKENAKRAGVKEIVSFKQCIISDFRPPESPGVIIINPPYGERMSVEDINNFYHSIGDAFKKNFSGYDAFIFTGNGPAAKHIGLRTSRRIEMHNGPIECRLLKFEMYKGSRKVKAE